MLAILPYSFPQNRFMAYRVESDHPPALKLKINKKLRTLFLEFSWNQYLEWIHEPYYVLVGVQKVVILFSKFSDLCDLYEYVTERVFSVVCCWDLDKFRIYGECHVTCHFGVELCECCVGPRIYW